jgi:hypothetical protein
LDPKLNDARAALNMKLSDQEAEQYIHEKLDRLTPRIAQAVHKLRNARPAWLKLVAAALLMVGGLFWFLPLVGIWMLPLGLILVADRFPATKRLLVKLLLRMEGSTKR